VEAREMETQKTQNGNIAKEDYLTTGDSATKNKHEKNGGV